MKHNSIKGLCVNNGKLVLYYSFQYRIEKNSTKICFKKVQLEKFFMERVNIYFHVATKDSH